MGVLGRGRIEMGLVVVERREFAKIVAVRQLVCGGLVIVVGDWRRWVAPLAYLRDFCSSLLGAVDIRMLVVVFCPGVAKRGVYHQRPLSSSTGRML